MGGKAVLLALAAAFALLGLCAQVSARARPPAVPAASSPMPMAGMDAACIEAMATAGEAQPPGRLDMTLGCIAEHGRIVVALVVEAAPPVAQDLPPEVQPPIAI